MDTPHLLWGLLRWRATAPSSGFESCYIFVKKFTLLCRGVNSLIFAEDLGHSKPFFLFSFCGCKGVQMVPIGIFGELKHLSIGFPMHPWLGLDDVSALTWDLRRSGQDVGESWWQELASLCILLLNILKKSPEAAQNVFFFWKIWKSGWYAPKKNPELGLWQHRLLPMAVLWMEPTFQDASSKVKNRDSGETCQNLGYITAKVGIGNVQKSP